MVEVYKWRARLQPFRLLLEFGQMLIVGGLGSIQFAIVPASFQVLLRLLGVWYRQRVLRRRRLRGRQRMLLLIGWHTEMPRCSSTSWSRHVRCHRRLE